MPEQQNTEYKLSWHDECLKWICGFANAHGGKIFIGMDDNGNTVGVADYKKLLEDIPNKVRDILGIMVDVNLLTQKVHNGDTKALKKIITVDKQHKTLYI
jgi:ATP-dependent DNA helicase RecG